MDESDTQSLMDSDQPRRDDPRGDQNIGSAHEPYDKYPPFSRGRLLLGGALLLASALALGVGALVDKYL